MALFFKKSGSAENRIENSGRWPLRLTQFHLADDYQFPATNFPEIFFVQEGHFLHETEDGTQAVRESVAMMVNPGRSHTVRQPKEVVITRVRFLPEWLTKEYEIIMRAPDVLSLFFDQSWFRHPRAGRVHVFTTRGEGASRVRGELEYLRGLLQDKRHLEPIVRVSLIKLMMLLADEHRRFWRGVSEIEIHPEARHALDEIERSVLRSETFDPAKMSRDGFGEHAIERAFVELTGMTLVDYARRRRIFHAASHLLTTSDDPARISKRLGWATWTEFSRQFEAVFDIPPAVYREKFGLPAEKVTEVEG